MLRYATIIWLKNFIRTYLQILKEVLSSLGFWGLEANSTIFSAGDSGSFWVCQKVELRYFRILFAKTELPFLL